MDRPETRYATTRDVHIAYQIVGAGPRNVVLLPAWVTHLDIQWELPNFGNFVEALSRFSRVILFDRRSTGLSDPIAGKLTFQQHLDDLRTVMDAAEAERATLFGYSEGGSLAVSFAASFPERTEALVLYGAILDGSAIPTELRSRLQDAVEHWGDGRTLGILAPDIVAGPVGESQAAIYERAGASREYAQALVGTLLDTDITPLLSSVAVPTLVLHRRLAPIPLSHAESLAQLISGSRYVPLDGSDHLPWQGDIDPVVAEIEEFLTKKRGVPQLQRFLATVMFTDIVASTSRAAAVGDERWRAILQTHDALVRAELERFGGREINTWGDSFFAVFDAPAPALRCACAIRDAVHDVGVDVRVGVHSGEVELHGETLAGIAVNIGARVAAHARPNEILVSRTVRDLIAGSDIVLAARGTHVLKGIPGRWQLFSLEQPPKRDDAGQATGSTKGSPV